MATTIPSTMRALAAPKKCGPEEYDILEFPIPEFFSPQDVLVRVHAASVMTGDCMFARGPPFLPVQYPARLGSEGSGIVAAVGPEVTDFKVGDAVYGFGLGGPILSRPLPGFCSEYAVIQSEVLQHKPPHLSFEDAAAYPGIPISAYQAFRQGMRLAGISSLEGKTVFIPAALSATGSAAIYVAKNMLGATRIISTVSTSKLPLVDKLLPGLVDQVVDYTTQKLTDVVPPGSVDIMCNTQWSSLKSGIPLVNPKTGVIVSLASIPTAASIRVTLGKEHVPFWMGWILDLAQYWYSFLLRGTNIKHLFVSGNPHIREDFELAGEAIALGKIGTVTRVVNMSNIKAVREECAKVDTGKGGVGRLVIRVIE